jgi:hypothetical protein
MPRSIQPHNDGPCVGSSEHPHPMNCYHSQLFGYENGMATLRNTLAVTNKPPPSVALVKAAKQLQHHGFSLVWSSSTASRPKASVQRSETRSQARSLTLSAAFLLMTQTYMQWRKGDLTLRRRLFRKPKMKSTGGHGSCQRPAEQ